MAQIKWPSTIIHNNPEWIINDGIFDTDTGEISLSVNTTSDIGYFIAKYMYVNVVCLDENGTIKSCDKICGVSGDGTSNIYENFNGNITIDLQNISEVYLAMVCSIENDTGEVCDNKPESKEDPGWEIPGTRTLLGTVPEIIGLSNADKLGDKDLVSNSRDSITIKVDLDWGTPVGKISWKCGLKTGESESDTFTITNLGSGLNYTVEVYVFNALGQSETDIITIRTKHVDPVITLQTVERNLEYVDIDWLSTQDLAELRYKFDHDEEYTVIDLTTENEDNYHPIRCYGKPNSRVSVIVEGTSTDIYDSQDTVESISLTDTTLDINRIQNPHDAIFSEKLYIDKIIYNTTHETVLLIGCEGNGHSFQIDFTNPESPFEWIPDQSQLDEIYKCFEDSNELIMTYDLSTFGDNDIYYDDIKTAILQLTGVAKTVHVGTTEKQTKRAQVYIGDSNKNAKKCVTWVGKSTTRRTI